MIKREMCFQNFMMEIQKKLTGKLYGMVRRPTIFHSLECWKIKKHVKEMSFAEAKILR